MANDFTGLVKQKYTKLVQSLLEEKLVAMDLANTTLLADMPDGNTINFPRPQFQNVQSYTKYTDVTDQDLDFTNEQLVINQTPIITFTLDEIDNLDNGYDVVASAAPKAAYRIKQDIEGNFFNEYSNASNSSASTIALTTSNVVDTYGNAYATLVNDGVDSSNIVAVLDPFQLNLIGQGALGNTYNVADAAYGKGYRGTFQNMDIVESTNLTCIASLALATNPTANDTVTINGVVFKFVASPSAAWDVDIWANAAASVDNIVAAINGAAGAGTDYIEVSPANRAKLSGITAVDNTTSIELTSKRGYKVLSSSLNASANKWGQATIHNVIMERGAIHLVMQKQVSLKVQDIQKQLGTRYMTYARYGIKTFTEGAERMYDLAIEAQEAES